MKPLCMAAVMLALAMPAAVSAQTQPREADVGFRQLDRDNNGYLTENELWSERGRSADWIVMDRDNDGRISREEFSRVPGAGSR